MRPLFFFFFFVSALLTAQTTAIYVSAHQDDWQLFMNPNVYNSIKDPDTKTLILHTTAGEAGEGMGKNSYFSAREKGSLAAVQFLSQINKQDVGDMGEMKEERVVINGKSILRYSMGKTHVYCLRLPDGNGTGKGYPLHENKSLEKLHKGEVNNLHSIDSTSFYKDIGELKMTLNAMISLEHKGGKLEAHLADTNTKSNPGDHSDHQTSSKIIQEILQKKGKATLYLYQNYSTGNLPNNVSKEEEMLCSATWGVTTAFIARNGHYSTWDDIHNSWIGKQYFITKKIP